MLNQAHWFRLQSVVDPALDVYELNREGSREHMYVIYASKLS